MQISITKIRVNPNFRDLILLKTVFLGKGLKIFFNNYVIKTSSTMLKPPQV